MLQSAIDHLEPEQFLRLLPKVQRDQHTSAKQVLDHEDPMFYWIFRNIDFQKWNSVKGPPVLYLSGPSERRVDQISSYIIDRDKNADRLVLHIFCSAIADNRPRIIERILLTLLQQTVCCLPIDKRRLFIRSFLYDLLQKDFLRKAVKEWGIQDLNDQHPS